MMDATNNRKICFILCTNNEQYAQECMLYLSLLRIPAGFEVQVVAIEEANSIYAGYNEGMSVSDAKYKVYLHQDTLIREPDYIQNILNVFQSDRKIGMIGMVGVKPLSKDGIFWHEDVYGSVYQIEKYTRDGLYDYEIVKTDIQEVDAVDGFLIATQYDIPWREDLFDGWDYYNISQCMEFKRAGYRIVVPAQREPWTIHLHRNGSVFDNYEDRKKILNEYPEIYKNSFRLRILFVHSKEITILGLPYSLVEMGHKVVIPDYQVELEKYSQKDVEYIEELLEEGNYDLVITYDFCMSIAAACHYKSVKYYSWIYDSPMLELYTKYAQYPTNYCSVFDRKQYERMKEYGLKNIFYLPLCSEVDVFGTTNITNEDEKKYAADVAFVGRLYSHRKYDELFDEADVDMKAEFDEVTRSCNCVWNDTVTIYDKASEELIEYIAGKEDPDLWEDFHVSKRFYCESMKMAGRCNEIERITILNKIAEKHNVTLYSDDSPKDMLHGVIIKPWVDYWAEMPKVFHISKINLNISSRSIETGIPQRIWDILSVGGFCLTNYQPELEDYFEIGKDLEVFHDLDELEEKIDYYLKNEKMRIRIAMNGYKKVRNKHNYQERMKYVLQQVLK